MGISDSTLTDIGRWNGNRLGIAVIQQNEKTVTPARLVTAQSSEARTAKN
jgi:hypothetical protein